MALQPRLSSLRTKIQLLLKQYANAQKEIKKLKGENKNLAEQLEVQKEEVERLSQKFAAANIGAMPKSAEGKKELEKKINAYLKEIDRCLAMLNN